MKKYTQEELNTIIENHQHWLRKDCDGWENMKADLSNTDLSEINLECIDQKYANLSGSNLMGTGLQESDLRYTNLKHANLYQADLYQADLKYANLSESDLSYSYLDESDLRCANLEGANLEGAYLNNAILRGARIRYTENIPFVPSVCPETGSFIGYKKANDLIVKLEILSDARRCSATGRKCRCDKARVLSIQNLNKDLNCNVKAVASDYDRNFIYQIGKIVEEPKFDENRWNECGKGIHFFINRQEAVEYFL